MTEPRTDNALGAAISRARLRNGLTQLELAERLGVSRALVAAWEAGRSQTHQVAGAAPAADGRK